MLRPLRVAQAGTGRLNDPPVEQPSIIQRFDQRAQIDQCASDLRRVCGSLNPASSGCPFNYSVSSLCVCVFDQLNPEVHYMRLQFSEFFFPTFLKLL